MKNFINFISFLEKINSGSQNGSIININVNIIFFAIFEKVLYKKIYFILKIYIFSLRVIHLSYCLPFDSGIAQKN